jgi:uncharacterized protein (DUF736 family)
MIIGTFKSIGSSFTGIIQTLAFKTEAVFELAEKKGGNSPDFRITTGNTDIGAAWKKTSEAGTGYLSVQIDDPTLPAPIQCALFKTGAEHGHCLVWDRPRKKARRLFTLFSLSIESGTLL